MFAYSFNNTVLESKQAHKYIIKWCLFILRKSADIIRRSSKVLMCSVHVNTRGKMVFIQWFISAFFQSSLDMPSVSIELTLHYGKYFSLLWRYNNVLLFNAYSSICCKTLYWWAHIFVSGLHTVFKYYWRSKTIIISPGVHMMFRGATSESAVNQTHVLQF